MTFLETSLSAALGNTLGKTEGEIYLAAVSGGADSTAMLAALAKLRKEAGFVLHCVHVEHGIRPADESRGDALAVQALCEKLEVPFHLVSIPPGRIAAYAGNGGPGIEAAARMFRRRAWNREARRTGAKYILTAHTRDDLLETLLMRILRGSGPAGLAAMPRSKGRILRPLLELGRQDVLAYLEERGIPYRTDSTNADIRFLRNRVRHKLVPLLDEFFPSWRSSLLSLAETQSLTASFLASEVRERLPWESLVDEGGGAGGTSLRLREEDFLKAPPILREEAIFAGADLLAANAGENTSGDSAGNSAGKRRKILRHVSVPRRAAVRRAAGQGAALADDLGPVRLRRQNGLIEMTSVRRSGADGRGKKGFSLLIKEAGFYTLKGRVLGMGKPVLNIRAGIPAGGAVCAGFCAVFPLVLRNHREGDRIYKGGHRRRFSDILDGEIRSGYTGIITAEDAEGPAAFVCLKRSGELLVISRDSAGVGGSSLFEVFGNPRRGPAGPRFPSGGTDV